MRGGDQQSKTQADAAQGTGTGTALCQSNTRQEQSRNNTHDLLFLFRAESNSSPTCFQGIASSHGTPAPLPSELCTLTLLTSCLATWSLPTDSSTSAAPYATLTFLITTGENDHTRGSRFPPSLGYGLSRLWSLSPQRSLRPSLPTFGTRDCSPFLLNPNCWSGVVP